MEPEYCGHQNGCQSPRQCRRYGMCAYVTMYQNQLDAAMARNDEEGVAKADLKLRCLEARTERLRAASN